MPRKRNQSRSSGQSQNQNPNQSQNQDQGQTQNQGPNQGQNQGPNAGVFFTGNDILDLELIEIEIAATYVDIFSSLLGLVAARQAEQLIIQKAMQPQQQNQQQNTNTNTNTNQNQNQNQDQQQQNQDQQQQDTTIHPTPSELGTFASCLGVFTILIYTRVAFIRLNEINDMIQKHQTNFTIGPNINITLVFLYSVIGNLLRTIGAIQRVNEEAEIIIF
ncbi:MULTISPECIES: hypothetical protein [unclassified Clostridium]|uniref:hypothetical protein n=1 Tax=unclassified Clostridium TaxID=2614128 RepID=UPI000297A28B|nr:MULTISPECIES: hypothetical protein [unclassified Clostridium]EKQ57453.1 MAG: hypothetical protein A370_00825 [Clostridium sp. Maddingley MBC34-26]